MHNSLVGVFWRNTRMRHGSEALGWSIVFLHIPLLLKGSNTETSSIHEAREFE
jgi:hypothetical protein